MNPAVTSAASFSVATVVDAAVKGDGAAWAQLFDTYHMHVYRYALARLGDHHAAEDITQETFTAAVESLHRLRDRSGPGVESWFIGVARNKIGSRLRKERHRGAEALRLESASDAETEVMGRATLAGLYEAMATLTEDQRDLLVRRYVLDHSLERVAEDTHRPLGAVKSMQHRALAALGRLVRTEAP